MDWIQATILTTHEGIEPVTACLMELGVNGTEVEDEQDFNAHMAETRQFWDYIEDELIQKMRGETRVKIYLTDSPDGRETLLSVREALERLRALDTAGAYGSLQVRCTQMNEQDWANNWRQYFKPLAIGEKILIRPVWEPAENAEGRIEFVIEPGMVFGTGAHESTRLCIEAAQRYVRDGDEVLDLGCGSGILSLIALLLGAKHAVGVDVDPNALQVARHNAELNDIAEARYDVLIGNAVSDEAVIAALSKRTYDVIFVNIVADVIMALSDRIASLIRPGGTVLAAGIIAPRKDEVIACLTAKGLTVREVNRAADWVGLVLTR